MDIRKMAKIIEENGGRLYLVGGAVRDKFLGEQPTDKDYCVTGMTDKEFQQLFPCAFKRGKFFPVYDIDNVEFALARKDIKIGNTHTDFEVHIGKEITIEEDLKRRDVTINSIAIDVLTNEIIDPFNGIQDIKNKIIKATSNAFIEDALRVYRVAVLATKYDFDIETNTKKMMSDLKSELCNISGERVLEELKKALRCNMPSKFFEVLKEVQCLDVHFKEIYDLIGVEQPEKYHPEGDAFNHTMKVVDRTAQMTKETSIRFAALLHDLGKGRTPKSEWPHHYGHEKNGIECINNMCNRLRVSNAWRKSALTACKEHMKGGRFNEMKSSTKVDFIEKVSKSILGLEGLEIIVNADEHLEEKIEFAKIGKYIMSNINGKDIDNISDYRVLKEKIREKRIKYIKEQQQ